jgi:hypothetical protein
VHVIATVEGRPVEIQIRTRLQHQWANLFEKFADIVGRGIRYGEPPEMWTVLFDVEFEMTARAVAADPHAAKENRDYAALIRQGESALELIIGNFMGLSDEIRACEMASTFHGDPEAFEEVVQRVAVPSLEEVEQRQELVLEAAQVLEATFVKMTNIRNAYAPIFEAAWSRAIEATGRSPEDPELDLEGLRAELRKRMVGLDFGSLEDDADPSDGEGGER